MLVNAPTSAYTAEEVEQFHEDVEAAMKLHTT